MLNGSLTVQLDEDAVREALRRYLVDEFKHEVKITDVDAQVWNSFNGVFERRVLGTPKRAMGDTIKHDDEKLKECVGVRVRVVSMRVREDATPAEPLPPLNEEGK